MRCGGVRYSDHLALRELIGKDFVCLPAHPYERPLLGYLVDFPEEVAIDVFPNRFYRKGCALLRFTLTSSVHRIGPSRPAASRKAVRNL